MLFHFIKKIINSYFPQHCLLCLTSVQTDHPLCTACEKTLPWLTYYCKHCGYYFNHEITPSVCGHCCKKSPLIDNFYGLWHYEYPTNYWIQDLKYHNRLITGKLCANYLLKKIPQWYQDDTLPEYLIPMPLHPKRLRERGYNQAIEIARPITKKLKIPLALHECIRSQYTQPQTTVPAKLRMSNVNRAFSIRPNFQSQHVAIIDDVYTTGSTVHDLCRSLRQAGIVRIDVWCCARTQKNIHNTRHNAIISGRN